MKDTLSTRSQEDWQPVSPRKHVSHRRLTADAQAKEDAERDTIFRIPAHKNAFEVLAEVEEDSTVGSIRSLLLVCAVCFDFLLCMTTACHLLCYMNTVVSSCSVHQQRSMLVLCKNTCHAVDLQHPLPLCACNTDSSKSLSARPHIALSFALLCCATGRRNSCQSLALWTGCTGLPAWFVASQRGCGGCGTRDQYVSSSCS